MISLINNFYNLLN